MSTAPRHRRRPALDTQETRNARSTHRPAPRPVHDVPRFPAPYRPRHLRRAGRDPRPALRRSLHHRRGDERSDQRADRGQARVLAPLDAPGPVRLRLRGTAARRARHPRGGLRRRAGGCPRSRRPLPQGRGGGAEDSRCRSAARQHRGRPRGADPGVPGLRTARSRHPGARRRASRLARREERGPRGVLQPHPARVGAALVRPHLPDRHPRPGQRDGSASTTTPSPTARKSSPRTRCWSTACSRCSTASRTAAPTT